MPPIRSRTIEANGLRFRIDEAGDGDAVALCLHGFPESRRSWRHQLPALAALGWRAVAPDLRGYGESCRPAGQAAYRIDRLIEDAAALFDALGARRRLLIGHDWGGMIAWTFAMRRAAPLDGLIVMNMPHPARLREELRRSWRQKARSWYVAFFQLPWLPERLLTANHAAAIGRAILGTAQHPARFPPEIIRHYRDNAAAPGAMTAMLNYYRANVGSGALPLDDTPVEVPTLLIWGEEDTALDRALVPGTERYVTDLTVRLLPGISHWVQQEAPEEVNAAMAAWLARTTAGAGSIA
jgi:epoxide hydrolase 4